MDTKNRNEEIVKEHYRKQNSSKKLFGLLFIGLGTVWALKEGGVELPSWIFSWGLLLIFVGIINGVKHNFKLGGWLIPILIGAVFFVDEFYPMDNIHAFLWPVVLVAVGVIMIFKPKPKLDSSNVGFDNPDSSTDVELLDITTIMGGSEKNVVSQNFKGGSIVSFLGGSQINFLKADVQGTAVLSVTCVMGGSKLTIPSNWMVKSEVTAIMGGVEDKRLINDATDPDKILVLKGTALMGGIEIVSH
jgi:predicted membrane protein